VGRESVLIAVYIALLMAAIAMFWYWSRDKQSRVPYLYAAYIAFGVMFGIVAWLNYIDHQVVRWNVWLPAAMAVFFPVSGIWSQRRKARTAKRTDGDTDA
jgi:hypothetical protein